MANVTIATIQCDSSIAVDVVKDFLKARRIDTSSITNTTQAKAALEAEIRAMMKQTIVEYRAVVDGDSAATTSRTTNNAAVVLA